VLDASPDLHRAVKEDKLSVHAAENIATLPQPRQAEAIAKVKQGDIKSARALTKDARGEASTRPEHGRKKGAKTIAKDAASAAVKETPSGTKTRPAISSAPAPNRSTRAKQEPKFNGHLVYAPLFAELDEVSAHLDAHPLDAPDARLLASELRRVAERVESTIKD
jgi:hypothetical protein